MLNKHNLKVAEFVSNEKSRYTLDAILVTDKATVATNGHYLVWVSVPAQHKAKDFPVIDHAPQVTDEHPPFLLGREDAAKILKALPRKPSTPILECAGVVVKGTQPIVEVTDLDCPQVFRPRPPEGKFPEWENVMPKEEPVAQFAVNAAWLAKLAKFAAEVDSGDNPMVVISFWGPDEAIRLECADRDGEQGMTALLMPVVWEGAKANLRRTYGWVEPAPAPEPEPEPVEAEAANTTETPAVGK